MYDDLISRRELKNVLFDFIEPNGFIYATNLVKAIDNAPTIPLSDFKDGYKQAILDGKTNYSRPQGEWIFGSTLGHGWMKCSNCCVSQSGQTSCWSYCPNCGAEMRGDRK